MNSLSIDKNTNIQKYAQIAGMAYLIIIGTSIMSMFYGPYTLIVEGELASTIDNIISNQMVFRVGIIYDLLMFVGVVILSVALYAMLKTVHKQLALTALFWRIGEALIGCITVLCSIIILWIINNVSGNILSTIRLLFEIKEATMTIVFTFLSLGTIIFCYLFYRSKFIPRWLAVFGIVSFTLMFTGSILSILFPVKSLALISTPAILFELVVGFWLVAHKIDTSNMQLMSA